MKLKTHKPTAGLEILLPECILAMPLVLFNHLESFIWTKKMTFSQP